ncbi:MAG: FkbM family methyltransferase [Candidatus Jorgensenbacteria bacterium]|nr:FkbM family methyltransferase [Candidatus Jorgensenbacteria bacterium]
MNYPRLKDLLKKVLLRIVPPHRAIPIIRGPLRGKLWFIHSGLGYWWGNYEPEIRKLLSQSVKRGDVVFDVGAHAGFYTLMSSVLAGASGSVVAFEALPENVECIRGHIALNRVANIKVVPEAVAEESGTGHFERGTNSFTGRLAPGPANVETISMDDFIYKNGTIPNVVKIDVEGTEVSVLKGAKKMLAQHRPIIIAATHNQKLLDDVLNILKRNHYTTELIGKPVGGVIGRPQA